MVYNTNYCTLLCDQSAHVFHWVLGRVSVWDCMVHVHIGTHSTDIVGVNTDVVSTATREPTAWRTGKMLLYSRVKVASLVCV